MKRFIHPCLMLLLLGASQAPAQDKKKDKKAEPRIVVILPLGAPAGKTTKVTIRGFRLDQAKEVKLAGGTAKIVSKGGAPVPDKNPEKVGDTQVVVEITLPATLPEDKAPITVVTPDGDTKPHPLLVEQKLPVIEEKEPNPGFRQAQPIKAPVVIEGVIGSPRDVDVFRLEGKKGQKLSAEVLAARHGSALDAMLSLYDERGELVAHGVRSKDGGDPRLECILPADGPYFLSLIDANDTGSAIHAYRLVVK